MRGVGDEPAQPLLRRFALGECRLDLAQHDVQGNPQAADLGPWRGWLDAPAVIAGRDLAGGGAHPLQRPQADVDDQPREKGRAHDDADADEQLEPEQLRKVGRYVVHRNRKDDGLAAE